MSKTRSKIAKVKDVHGRLHAAHPHHGVASLCLAVQRNQFADRRAGKKFDRGEVEQHFRRVLVLQHLIQLPAKLFDFDRIGNAGLAEADDRDIALFPNVQMLAGRRPTSSGMRDVVDMATTPKTACRIRWQQRCYLPIVFAGGRRLARAGQLPLGKKFVPPGRCAEQEGPSRRPAFGLAKFTTANQVISVK